LEGGKWFGSTPRHTILFPTNPSGTNDTGKRCRVYSGCHGGSEIWAISPRLQVVRNNFGEFWCSRASVSCDILGFFGDSSGTLFHIACSGDRKPRPKAVAYGLWNKTIWNTCSGFLRNKKAQKSTVPDSKKILTYGLTIYSSGTEIQSWRTTSLLRKLKLLVDLANKTETTSRFG
jgi:hypothetical protein